MARDGWGYTVFGEVAERMDVIDRIAAVPKTSRGPHQNMPLASMLIKAVRLLPAATQP